MVPDRQRDAGGEHSVVQIREARSDDAPGIAAVHVASWRTTYRCIIPDEHLARLSVEQRAQRWRETLAGGADNVYVAEDDAGGEGRVIGFASGGPERDRNIPVYDGELYAVYILQEYQGQGIGQRLVRAVAERLATRGFNAMLVWVLASNPSRGFYERLGGQFVREKAIEIGSASLPEVAYGWQDIRALLETL